MADLAAHCGVAERTLNEHFRRFLDTSPMRYFRRLRLSAAREALLTGKSGISVTEVAKCYEFNHFGRFSAQYRRAFGEAPSKTLNRARTARLAKEREFGPESDDGFRPSLLTRNKPSIAVLPFQRATNEPALRWQAESIVDALAVSLCAIQSIDVKVPGNHLTGTRDLRRAARELRARYLLTGRMMPAGSRVRIILRLVDSATWQQVWGDRFEGERDEILELQDRVIRGTSSVLRSRVRGAEIDRAQRTAPENLDAHGLVMRALPLVFASQTPSAERALELLSRALELDPDYSLATALSAWCHGQLVMLNGTLSPAAEKRKAAGLLQRVAVFDEDDPLVLVARGAVHMMAGALDAADSLLTRALAQDPTFGWAWGRSGWLNSYRGEPETAIEHFNRAISLEPFAASKANCFAGIGSAHFYAGRYDAAAFWLRKVVREHPDMWWANRSLSVSYARLGNRQLALESLNALRRHRPDLTVGQVQDAVPFRPDFLDRLGEGLSELGLPH